ncbi:hypothetical protein BJ165DRAFT_690007 [Panaeolus papilionaceus]|nr:hypothetical protein BJ165DRAFT_690007 [Panaeolus papilionaceus]
MVRHRSLILIYYTSLGYKEATPALRLPPEIWSRIFCQVVSDSWDSKELGHRKPPWVGRVTHVCQYWRNIALNDPQLWSRISSFSSKWADIQLERSKTAPLHFRISSMSDTQRPTIFRRIKKALNSQSHRLYSLTFATANPYSPTRPQEPGHILQKLYTGNFPVLTTLTVDIACHLIHRPNLAPEFIRESIPALQHLNLRGFKFLWTLTLFSGLTSLRLETETEIHSMGTLDEFLTALERMPLLEKLHIQWVVGESHIQDVGSVDESRIVAMAHLQNLTLRITNLYDCVDILSHIAYPASSRIRLHFEGGGSDAANEFTGWYDEDEIGEITAQDLSSCLESTFLTNSLIQRSATDPTAGLSSDRSVRTVEISTHFVRQTYVDSQARNLVFKAWFQEVDFTKYPHPITSNNSTYSSDQQIPPPAAYITIRVGFEQDLDVEIAKQYLLFLLPLSKLQSIAIDQESTPGFFRLINDFPDLRVISMQGRSAIQFFEYLRMLYGTIENGNYTGQHSDGHPSESPAPKLPGIASDGRATPFPSLDSLAFEHSDFGSYLDPSINERTLKRSELLTFLRLRKDVLGLPIQRIRFRDCINFFAEDVEEVRKLVQDIEWDGKIQKRADSECDSEPPDGWETDDEWGWDGNIDIDYSAQDYSDDGESFLSDEDDEWSSEEAEVEAD